MSLNDEELVARAKADDQRAIEELFLRYHSKAYSLAYHLCSDNGEEALDIIQEAFLKTAKNIKKFREQASFSTWFYRIVVNTCLDFRRTQRKKERIFPFWPRKPQEKEESKNNVEAQSDPKGPTNPMVVFTGQQLTQDIQNALASLPEKQRMVFQLKVLHEMSIREIAQVMGSSEGTIKSHLFRATHSLRNNLKEWAES